MTLLRYLFVKFSVFALVSGNEPDTKTVGSYKYELFNTGLPFANAISVCKTRNAWLVEVKDQEIATMIASWTTHEVFVGAKYDDVWKWNDDSLMIYTNWTGNEPIIDENNCLVVYNGKWTYPLCGIHNPRRYICQSDINYLGSFQITIETTKKSYDEAKTACENNNGSRLVDIKTPALDSHIDVGGDIRWTGGKYVDGSWKWGDLTLIEKDDSGWGKSHPKFSSDEYCLMKTVSDGWRSKECSMKAGYICQKNVTSGDCSNDTCSNRGKCKIVGQRYKCSCIDGYFGTKCEKEIVRISSTTTTFTVKKGFEFSTTFNILSYDGNVEVKHVNSATSLASTSKITKSVLTDTVTVSLGTLCTDAEFTFYATSINAKSQNITIVVEVVDHCKSNPCKNNGSCHYLTRAPYFNCSCTPAYEGKECEERVFVEKNNCKYHVNYDETVETDAANSTCKNLGGSLAMMKSSSIQDFVEEQIVNQYGASGNTIGFWIGGVRYANSWHWIDETLIPITGDDSKWYEPNQYKSDRDILILSSHDKRARSQMKWISKENDEPFGYICEVPVDSNSCTSFRCKNDGTCIAVGCQENCHCAPGYSGTYCENEIFNITSESQTFTSLVGQNITVTISIKGYSNFVKIDVFEESYQSETMFTKYDVNNTIDIFIGPFEKLSFGTRYWFRATPQSDPDKYYKSTSITVVVEGPSKIEGITPKTLAIPTVTEENVIRCNATGVPIPSVFWYKENRIVTNNFFEDIYQTSQPGHASLFVKSNSRVRFGNYTCYSYNVVNGIRAESNSTAFLRGKIKLVSITSFNEVMLGRASITCIYEGYPKPDVQWELFTGNNWTKIDSDHIFSIQNFFNLTSGIINATSQLNISLVEYLGPTKFACYGSNIYEKTGSEIVEINKNVVVDKNRAFRFFNLTLKRNYTDSMKYCIGLASNLGKITDNHTQNTLAARATQLGFYGRFYIGATKLKEDGSIIWRWHDQTFLYNETNHKRWQSRRTGEVVDGSYVAWANDPASLAVDGCLTMQGTNNWQWADVDCSELLPFICEKEVAGTPLSFETGVDECSSNITINLKPALEAIGVGHRIDIAELDENTTKVFSNTFIPEYQNEVIRKSVTNLKRWTSYNITITVCPEVCPFPSTTSKIVPTHAGIPEQVSSANVTQLNETCLIIWKMKFVPGITGFMLIALSTLKRVESKSYMEEIFEERRNVTNTSNHHYFLYNLNRVYTFSIQAETCAGAGAPVNAVGTCITPTGPPNKVLGPSVAPLPNADDTVNITITFPDETNGPISCIFVIVVYKPNRSLEENISSFENLQTAMTKAESASLSKNDAYIAIAISRSDINKEVITKMNFSRTLGDESLSSCNLTKPQKAHRKKRETAPTTNIKAINLKLENNVNYSYYTLSTTPGEKGVVHYKMSQRSFFTKIEYSNQNNNAALPLSIVIVGVLTFVILLIIAIIFAGRRKNRSKNLDQPDAISLTDIDPAPQEQLYANLGMDNCEPKSETEISLEQLLDVYNLLRDKDCAKFYEQFEKLKKTANSLEYPTSVASSVSLKKKNRYKNILPSDYSRVKLKGEGDFSYINACYISGFSKPKKFIATQGPLPTTIIDFWRMIFEQKVQVVIMLTKCMENGRRKCEKYWPDQGLPQQYGSIAVTNVEELSFGCFKLRTFKISRENQERTLHQMQFLNWPDHGVPISTTNLIRFCEAGRKHEITTDGPIVVHCSAGAGRTGAFIAYDFLLEESEALGSVDVYRCVLALRKQRVDMVQTCEQYMIVHKLILEHYLFGLTDTDPIEMKRMKESYSDATMKKQFEDLSTIGPLNQIRYQQGEKVSVMNRNNDIVPYEHNHVTITRSQEDIAILYVNASTIEIYGDIKLIAAQGPLKNTVEYFWRAILDNNINTIVMLTRCTEKKKEQCYRYWPEKEYTDINIGNIIIHLRAEDIEEPIIRRELLVKRKDDEKTIIQYQYTKWDSNECPENASDVLELVEKMKSCLKRDEYASALVHCSNGAGRTGAFCAIVNLLERLVNERRIDVFRAVKDLRDCRPGMVQTLDQYRFCYKAVSKYLESFSLYANFVQTDEDQVEENPYENI